MNRGQWVIDGEFMIGSDVYRKKESEQLAKKYEQNVGTVRVSLAKSQERVAELDNERHRLTAIKADLIEQIGLGKQELAQAVERSKLSDHRCEALSRQLSMLIQKESVLVQERKRMRMCLESCLLTLVERELDKATLERDRYTRETQSREFRSHQVLVPPSDTDQDDGERQVCLQVFTQKQHLLAMEIERVKMRSRARAALEFDEESVTSVS